MSFGFDLFAFWQARAKLGIDKPEFFAKLVFGVKPAAECNAWLAGNGLYGMGMSHGLISLLFEPFSSSRTRGPGRPEKPEVKAARAPRQRAAGVPIFLLLEE
ncbi:MAG: hypothetical protein KDJ15_06375 [Alphaproteobacteria bacterium]|nr:hypothetical protein [Alphaproteobacteria bacterium]